MKKRYRVVILKIGDQSPTILGSLFVLGTAYWLTLASHYINLLIYHN